MSNNNIFRYLPENIQHQCFQTIEDSTNVSDSKVSSTLTPERDDWTSLGDDARKTHFECSPENVEASVKTEERVRHFDVKLPNKPCNILIVVGASGTLARTKIYPALYKLFRSEMLRPNTFIVGFSRSDLSVEDIRRRCLPYAEVDNDGKRSWEKFWDLNRYSAGSYTDEDQTAELSTVLEDLESEFECRNRYFLLAVPFATYISMSKLIRKAWKPSKGHVRIVMMNSFGPSSKGCKEANDYLMSNFHANEICRIDRYLCVETMQAILALRFTNSILSNTWNRESISRVTIIMKDTSDNSFSGDILHSTILPHLFNLLCMITMDKPISESTSDFQREKVRILRSIRPLETQDIVLGKCVSMMKEGSDQNSKLAKGNQPSFATFVAHIDTERWHGVPFIFICGENLDKSEEKIKVTFWKVPAATSNFFPGITFIQNEVLLSLRPIESIKILLTGKLPHPESEMAPTYSTFSGDGAKQYEQMEKHVLNFLDGKETLHHFSMQELYLIWSLVEPVIKDIEEENIKMFPYKDGSKGPASVESLLLKYKQHR